MAHLKAKNRSPATRASYERCALNLGAFLAERGMPTEVDKIHREHVEAFLGDMLDRLSPATAAKHYRSLQQYFKWLEAEGEIASTPMARMSPPHVPEQPVEILTDDELRRLLASCKGSGFAERRDTAIIKILDDCGIRLGEIAGLTVDDVEFGPDVLYVMGKGRRGRTVNFVSKTSDALRRYLRVRAKHPHCARKELWLSRQGPLTPSGLAQVLERRGTQAGVPNLHPHRFRHTHAHVWLAAGLGEQDLMANAGWRSRQMLGRYGASAAAERAREAHRRAALGDRL